MTRFQHISDAELHRRYQSNADLIERTVASVHGILTRADIELRASLAREIERRRIHTKPISAR